MLCDKCLQREATYHSTVNINGNVTSSHLCSECASRENKTSNLFTVGNFFKPSLFDLDLETENEQVKTEGNVCSFCKKSYDNFLTTGLIGCANCYIAFKEHLLPVIKSVQYGLKHVGKELTSHDHLVGQDKTIKNLEFKLKQAVANENYELASELKKKINELKNLGGQDV